MKKLILLMMTVFLTPALLYASIILPEKKFKVVVQEENTDIKNLQLDINIICSRGGNAYFGGSKSCGKREINIPISNDNSFNVPQIETFPGWFYVGNVDHYSIYFLVRNKAKPIAFGSILFGKVALEKYPSMEGKLTIARSKAFSVKVNMNGENFFSSDLSRNYNSELSLAVFGGPTSTFSHTWYRSNLGPQSGPRLKDEVEILVPSVIYFSLGADTQTVTYLKYSEAKCLGTDCGKRKLEVKDSQIDLGETKKSYTMNLN